ncbi:hypothetical protein PIB30_111155 [Stylosanthes scabra]|uniref:Uncharacterized protein n=1 Tax=Stylosanthes scabra TaxID=79078 RepID=A0ABU6S128_9FABA|nr:hypothetical protein [Stylosanthes scabra]
MLYPRRPGPLCRSDWERSAQGKLDESRFLGAVAALAVLVTSSVAEITVAIRYPAVVGGFRLCSCVELVTGRKLRATACGFPRGFGPDASTDGAAGPQNEQWQKQASIRAYLLLTQPVVGRSRR